MTVGEHSCISKWPFMLLRRGEILLSEIATAIRNALGITSKWESGSG